MALVVAASIILPARATPPSGVSVTPLAPVAQFNEINANATDGGNGLPVITNLPTATNPYTNFSTGGQKFCRLSQCGLEIVSSCRPSFPPLLWRA